MLHTDEPHAHLHPLASLDAQVVGEGEQLVVFLWIVEVEDVVDGDVADHGSQGFEFGIGRNAWCAPVGPYEGDGREALWMIASCLGPRAALEESPSALGNESAEPITLVSGTQPSVRPGSRSSANSGRVSAGKILKAEYDCDRATAH